MTELNALYSCLFEFDREEHDTMVRKESYAVGFIRGFEKSFEEELRKNFGENLEGISAEELADIRSKARFDMYATLVKDNMMSLREAAQMVKMDETEFRRKMELLSD